MFETKSKLLARLACYSLSSAFLISCGGEDLTEVEEPEAAEWQLVWEDNFTGEEIDVTKWDLEHNCYGGGNNEAQCYTDRTDANANAWVADGFLNIEARPEEFTGPDVNDDHPSYPGADVTRQYTSARLRTRDLADWRFGRFEMRAKMPAGQGAWAAFWMLPTESPYGEWPVSGEIDIVETVNLKASGGVDGGPEDRIFGTTHYGRPWPGQQQTGTPYQFPGDPNPNPADDFHTYAVEWEYGVIRWYVDGVHYATQVEEKSWWSQIPAQVLNDEGELEDGFINAPVGAPFDGEANFYLILNLALGGSWAGSVNEGGINIGEGTTMQVDYVRVYQCSTQTISGSGCGTGATAGNAGGPQDEGGLLAEAEMRRPSLNAASFAPLPEYFIFDESVASQLEVNSYNPNGLVTTYDVVDSEEEAYGNVFNLVKAGTGPGNAYFTISGGAGSLAHWLEDGGSAALVFDVKVNSRDAATQMLIKMDSGVWPNASDVTIDFPPTGEWGEISIDLETLIESGNSLEPGTADIDNIVNIFVMEPFGGAIDVYFDNIRLTQELPTITVFDDAETQWEVRQFSANAPEVAMEIVADPVDPDGHGNVIQFSYSDSENVTFLQSDVGSDFSAYVGGTLEFDMYVVTQPAGAWMMKMETNNESNSTGDVPLTDSVEGIAPPTGAWQHYTFNIEDLLDRGPGLDLSNVTTPLVIFPAWAEQTGAEFRIDNVVIKPGN